MAQLPRVLGTLSDAAKLKFSNINSQLAEMLFLDISPAGMTDFTTAWSETNSGTNVNVSAGVATMKGNGSWAANGLRLTSGVARAEGYFEIKVTFTANGNSPGLISVSNLSALPAGAVANTQQLYQNALSLGYYNNANSQLNFTDALSTGYTIKIYVLKNSDGVTWNKTKVTISGGAWTTETLLLEHQSVLAAFAATLYLSVQTALNNANLTSFSAPKWYSGYSTAAPYVEYVHDAGAGKVFDNFDMTALVMPGTVPSTNLTFSYYFGDDSGGAYSAAQSLANFNLNGKITARYRYIKIKVLLNSDGSTQIYADKPNSDTAIDGVGDFPATSSVLDTATVQLSAGTKDHLEIYKATDSTDPGVANVNVDNVASYKINGATKTPTFSEAGRNTDMAANKVEALYNFITRGTNRTGSLTAFPAPTAPVLVAEILGPTSCRLTWGPGVLATSFQPKYKLAADSVYTNFGSAISAATVIITGLTASSAYNFKVTATNAIGSTDSNIEAKTTGAVVDILTVCEARMVVDIEAMTTAGGYNYNWGNCNEVDMVLKDAFPNAEIFFPDEDNIDSRDGTDAGSYSNDVTVEIHVYGKLTTVTDNPKFNINTEHNKALDDLKRCFALDPQLNNNCLSIRYAGFKREYNKNGDLFSPGKLITRWIVSYSQDRTTPTLTCN